MATDLTVARDPTNQPDPKKTRKSQKRYQAKPEYDAQPINSEFDLIHARINSILVEDPAISDVSSAAVLATVITRLNLITDTLRKAGLIRSE